MFFWIPRHVCYEYDGGAWRVLDQQRRGGDRDRGRQPLSEPRFDVEVHHTVDSSVLSVATSALVTAASATFMASRHNYFNILQHGHGMTGEPS